MTRIWDGYESALLLPDSFGFCQAKGNESSDQVAKEHNGKILRRDDPNGRRSLGTLTLYETTSSESSTEVGRSDSARLAPAAVCIVNASHQDERNFSHLYVVCSPDGHKIRRRPSFAMPQAFRYDVS